MTVSRDDVWGDWILGRRDGGVTSTRDRLFNRLAATRDQVLDGASITRGDVLLDVGCGDGFISQAALDRVGSEGHVVFIDVSERILATCRQDVERRGLLGRASFVYASADELGPIADSSADVITTRAVLIYLDDKRPAFSEFHRVLRPGGRISVWEPINGYGEPEPANMLLGYDLSDALTLGGRVKAAFLRHQPPAADPMLHFDERDLVGWAEAAGFCDIWLRLEVQDAPPQRIAEWDAFLDSSPNPLALTWRQAVEEALDPREATVFLGHLRESALAGRGRYRRAGAHLVARKPQ
jgi:SAM-dependent methyltransferase